LVDEIIHGDKLAGLCVDEGLVPVIFGFKLDDVRQDNAPIVLCEVFDVRRVTVIGSTQSVLSGGNCIREFDLWRVRRDLGWFARIVSVQY
jgi:hypothetical protein